MSLPKNGQKCKTFITGNGNKGVQLMGVITQPVTIHHNEGDPFCIHPDYLAICPERWPQATALQVLENEMDTQHDRAGWLFLTLEEFSEKSLRSYYWRTFYDALKQLERRGFVRSRMALSRSHKRFMKQYRLECGAINDAIEKTQTGKKTDPQGGNLIKSAASPVYSEYTASSLVKSTRGA